MKDFLLEETEIALTHDVAEALYADATNREDIFAALLKSNEPDCKTMLGGYYYDSKGSVERVKLKQGSLELLNEVSGTFSVEFYVNYHMGCSDTSYDDRQEMKIAFEVDIQRKVMKIIGERIPVREPDDF